MIKILLVDDEKGITDLLKTFFQERGFYVETADSGEQALEAIEKNKPNIMFLDIKMKNMDGLQTLEKVKKIDKNIKVIMLTVIEDKEIMEKAKNLGADEYITKPFRTEYLEEVFMKKLQGLLNEKKEK